MAGGSAHKHTLLPGSILFLMLLAPFSGKAQDHTHTRSVSKSFPANLETTLEVENKYGQIQVMTWEKDSVAIDVDIFLTESSPSKLRKLKDDVNIRFSGTNTYIIARTVIESETGRIASELRSIGNTLIGTNKRMEINYMVRVPDYLDVVLLNKFGDIFLDDLSGRADIELSNGVLKANRLDGTSTLSLSFTNGMIKTLGSATMSLSYSDLVLGEAGQLDLESKSSKLNVDSVNVVKINSRRDQLYFKKVEYLYGQGNFSQVWVYDFLRESDLYMKYGKLTIEHVLPRFNKIFIESDYTDLSLMFHRDASFGFDIFHHERSVLRLPGEGVDATESFDGKEHYTTTGTMGSGDPSGELKIDALQKCFITVSFK